MAMARVDLGTTGREYIAERLAGGLALSALALTQLDLTSGNTFTWSSSLNAQKLLELDRGDVVGDGATAPIIHLVRSFFADAPIGGLWVEETNPRRSDPFWDDPAIPRDRKRAWFLGEEVYSLAFSDDDDDSIQRALMNGWWWSGWGGASYLSTAPVEPYRSQNEIAQAELPSVVLGTQYVICGAYDGGGWVIWERRSDPDPAQVTSPNPG